VVVVGFERERDFDLDWEEPDGWVVVGWGWGRERWGWGRVDVLLGWVF